MISASLSQPESSRTTTTADFKQYFLSSSAESTTAYRAMVARVADDIAAQIASQSQPYVGTAPAELRARVAAVDMLPALGTPLADVLDRTRALVLEHNISTTHPRCVAHLHCPTFIASLAAEMILTAFNTSMDSWDQGPAATFIEQELGETLCRLYGLGPDADATFTSGGTMSNFMALLLARDHYCQSRLNWNVQQHGLPPEASRFRILCSDIAHFSVVQSASILGLGAHAVVKIPAQQFGEETQALRATLAELAAQNLLPIAYVSTAGTTDFGTVSSLSELADVAHAHNVWFHVDAAYGGALQFSQKHRHQLAGIEKADSLTVDFHKLFYQPISCGVVLVRNRQMFDYIRLHAEYLNPASNEELGILDLVYKSIQTTRRFDALKPFLALQHVGTERFGQMIDHTIALAERTADYLHGSPSFELAMRPTLNAVVFRYLPALPLTDAETDALNRRLKTDLLLSGEAIIGQTEIDGRAFLKFTLLNPLTEFSELESLLHDIRKLGAHLETQVARATQEA